MHFYRLAKSLRLPAIALFSILLAACGSGDGESSVDAADVDAAVGELRVVFRDDFGGPAEPVARPGVAPRKAPPAALPPGDWVAETGYGENGWGNDEWQLYQNSMDNLFTENGSLVIRAKCQGIDPNDDVNLAACGKRDGSITSARIITKNRLNVRYGNIKARIKMPSGAGMWPAFWTLGSDIDKRPWPNAGEIDIVEMHYYYSDTSTTHFSTHWSGPKYTDETRPICAANVDSVLNPDEEENCKTFSKTFDDPLIRLTDDFHVYELDWNENRIVGKIDGITYFTQGIDPGTMEEFLKDHFLLLNVAVGGTLGGPNGPAMTGADWADPDQTDMLVDWVEVSERVPPSTLSVLENPGTNPYFNRIINSVEFNGGFVDFDEESTAVTPLVGSTVLELNYSNTISENGSGVPAGFAGAIFDLNNLNLSSYTKLVFSVDTSQFPGLKDIGIEFEDSTGAKVLLRTRDYTPVAFSGNWITFEIPLADFAGVDLNDIVRIGLFNPYDDNDKLIRGTLFVDNINFVTEACAANASVAFDAINYRSDAVFARVVVNDTCAASSLTTVKVETGTDEIFVGVNLDAAGYGEAIFSFVSPVSVCPASDENSTIALSDPLIATYRHTYRGPGSIVRTDTATAAAGIDPNAVVTNFVGELSFIIAADSNQTLTYAIDLDFNVSDFGTGSQFNGNFQGDATFSPVWSIGNAANTAAVFAMFNFTTGFTSGQDSINFKVKDMPNNVVVVKFGDNDQDFSVSLTSPPSGVTSSQIGSTGWYEVSIPMSNFPTPDDYNYLVIKSEVSAQPVQFLVTDIFLEASLGSVGSECAAPATAAPTPTEDPADVISVLSSVYTPGTVVDTWAQFGNAVLFETTLGGTEIKRYSNLGFVGIQTESSPIDASQMTNLRIDVWSTEVSQLKVVLVDFLGDGFDNGTNNSEASVVKPLTAGQWSSIDIPLSEFTGAGLASTSDINQMILAAEVGGGTIFIGNVYYYDDGSGVNLITNGDFETGDLTGWTPALGGGVGMSSITVVDTQNSGSTWSANIVAGQQNNPALSQANLAAGTVNPGDTIDISFDWCGSAADGGEVAFALLSEVGVNAGSTRDEFNRTASPPNVWTRFNTSRTAGVNVDGGISLQFDVVCGGAASCSANVYFDNVSVTRGGGPAPGAASGQSCVGGGPVTEPPVAAPTPPARNPVGVISLFSDAYADVPVDTWRTVWSSATLDESFVVDGSATKLYTALDFVGIEFANPTIDASGMTHIHVDVWTPDDTSGGEVFRVKLVDFGTGTEHEIAFDSTTTPALATGTWVGLDIPLSDFTSGNLAGTAALGQLIFSGTLGGGPGLGTVYIDNVYFYNSSEGSIVPNGDFETGALGPWMDFPQGGIVEVSNVQANGGTYSARLRADVDANAGNASFPALKIERVGGSLPDNGAVTVTFDAIAVTQTPANVVFNALFFTENNDGDPVDTKSLFAGMFLTDTWQTYTFNTTLGPNANGGVSLLFQADCGATPGCVLDAYIDNVSVTVP